MHRANLYTVRVHRAYQPADERLLGSMNDAGDSLLDFIDHAMDNFAAQNALSGKTVTCARRQLDVDGDELFLVLQDGETGTAADILDPGGALRIRQDLDDTS